MVVLVLALGLGAVAIRRHVLNAQRVLAPQGNLPFTLESALAFRRVQMVYRDGALPERDGAIGYPDGIVTSQTDSTGAEWALARAAKAWPGVIPLAEKIRWLDVLWFSMLAMSGMYAAVRWAGGGGVGGTFAAALYAVAISAVARSTGQELSHENNALPLVIWGLAGLALAERKGTARNATGQGKGSGFAMAAAGWAGALALTAALCLWDLVQYALGLLWLLALAGAWTGRLGSGRWRHMVVPLFVAMAVAAFANPYLRAHGFWGSPVMGLALATLLAGVPALQKRNRWGWRTGAALLTGGGLVAGGRLFAASYSHFGSLLMAKLRFMNQRPLNPAELTFDQRILWAPALNSTAWESVWEWFPALLVASAIALGIGLWIHRRRPVAMRETESTRTTVVPFAFLAMSWGVSLVAFILFFRFHAWLSLFACALTGLIAGECWQRAGRGGRWTLTAIALLVWGIELSQPCIRPLRWGRPYIYPNESAALMDHLRRYVAPEAVAANFGASAAIATYGGCPVLLHPKFETPQIRRDVQAYGEALFRGTEADFKRWMQSKGATVYVHSMGEFSDVQPGLQMRYMVNVLHPATNAAARLFEQHPEDLTLFTPQFANIKYRVFRLKDSPDASRHADLLAEQATLALQNGCLATASYLSAHALRIQPQHVPAATTLQHATALIESGMTDLSADDDSTHSPALFPLDDEGRAPAIAPPSPPWPVSPAPAQHGEPAA